MTKTNYWEKLPWSEASELTLLDLVRDKRHLWDHKHPLFSKIKLRQETFQNVADILKSQHPEFKELNGDHIRVKFKKIRTYFMNVYKKNKCDLNDGFASPPKWYLFDSSSFLLDSVLDSNDSCCSFGFNSEEERLLEQEMLASVLPPTVSLDHTDQEGVTVTTAVKIEVESYDGTSPSSSSDHQTASTSMTEATASVKRPADSQSKQAKKKMCTDSDNKAIDISDNYARKRQSLSLMAVSLGLFVEAAVDKMPHDRQIWFAQKLTNLIAEASDLPGQND